MICVPKELVAVAPGEVAIREYEEPLLAPNQVRIKSELSAEKHGTTMSIYRGISPLSDKRYDSELGLFLPKSHAGGWTASFPMKLGNITVGTVTEFTVICRLERPIRLTRKPLILRRKH